uniref:NADH-ubiquinone oxidoreductase chain 4 n=1 Tax=Bicellonychia lividipennis TaxID=1176499 RepID=A0A158V2M6_9COLE|nr:NADH dehydrogenase subunit 4 [Bicellonychia lividipennis]AIQ80143.1 NADH dehydrogenase subunit 4 [Bicellonychia lividipennis]
MMKLILVIISLTPLCFLMNYFWIIQISFFLLFFMVFLNMNLTFFYTSISYMMGCDYISYLMILLSIWICTLMIMASEKIYSENNFPGFFCFTVLMLLFSLILTFGSMNMFMFYIFFEVSLIPTLILILGWGYQPERIQAGMYMLMYTLFGSLPMIISLLYMYKNFYTLDIYYLSFTLDNVYLYLCTIFVFLVKIPMYSVHLWLPKAHVEAPISGSMILAGVMLKLGGYGLIRFMKIYMVVGLKFNFIIMSISLMGGFIISLICLRQMDVKSLIAYSSVSHMSLVLGGLMTMNSWGLYGSVIMMVSHGLCSSGLFCLANCSYERLSSRSLFLKKGLINVMPSMSLWWFLLCSSNMAAPPSLNLLGEIMLINSLVSYSWLMMIFVGLISFFGGCYSLYLYSSTQHGKMVMGTYAFSSGNIREYLLMFLHWVPLNLIFLVGDSFIC